MIVAQVVLNGLLVGSLWALLGIGKGLILGTLRFVNFAHANFALIGMYIMYFAWNATRINPYLLLPAAGVGLLVLGLVLDRPFVRPLVAKGQRAQILATLGLYLMLADGANLLFGPDTRSVITPWNTSGFSIGSGIFFTVADVVTGVVSFALVCLTWYAISRLSFGLRVRATAQNREAAIYNGINIQSVYGRAFALSLALAGLVGGLYAISTPIDPNSAGPLFILMFVVSIVGGLGSLGGNLLGGLAVGVVQGLTVLVLPAQLENAVVFAVFLVMLMLRPQGFLGNPDIVRQGPL